jgi:phospholipase/carboxylesterase
LSVSRDLYVHRRIEGAKGGPLLLLMHGTGGDESQFLGIGPRLVPGATLVAPRGDVSEFGAARFFRRTGEGVYDMADLARATEKLADFVDAHAAGGETAGVYGLGYSNGANILASVAFARPRRFDRLVLMHPLIPFEPQFAGRLDGTRILVTAGRRDPICPPELTVALERAFAAAGAATEIVWHDGGHEIRPSEIEAAASFLSDPGTG